MLHRIILWIAALAGALALFVLVNNVGTLAVLIVVAVMPVFSGVALLVQARHLVLSLNVPASCVVGEQAPASIVVSGAPRLALCRVRARLVRESVFVGTRDVDELSVEISRTDADRCVIPFTIESQAPGRVEASFEACYAVDLLGMFKRRLMSSEPVCTTFKPETFAIDVALSPRTDNAFDNERYSMELSGGDPTETFALREYRMGDPMRSIHWKLSEKVGEPIVRELGLPIVSDVLLVFENRVPEAYGLPSARVANAMAASFLSLSCALVRSEVSHALCWQVDGVAVFHEVEDETSYVQAEHALLTTSIECNEVATPSRIREQLGSCPYAHVVCVASYDQPDRDALNNGNRVTAIVVGAERSEEYGLGIMTSDQTCAEDLRRLEI